MGKTFTAFLKVIFTLVFIILLPLLTFVFGDDFLGKYIIQPNIVYHEGPEIKIEKEVSGSSQTLMVSSFTIINNGREAARNISVIIKGHGDIVSRKIDYHESVKTEKESKEDKINILQLNFPRLLPERGKNTISLTFIRDSRLYYKGSITDPITIVYDTLEDKSLSGTNLNIESHKERYDLKFVLPLFTLIIVLLNNICLAIWLKIIP